MVAIPPILAGALHLTFTTASAIFTTARVVLWAFLIAVAWYEIIEKAEDDSPRKRKAKQARAVLAQQHPRQVVNLTATALHQLDEQNPPRPRWPAHVPPMAGVSEMGDDESIDQWSIWNEGRDLNGATPQGQIQGQTQGQIRQMLPAADGIGDGNGAHVVSVNPPPALLPESAVANHPVTVQPSAHAGLQPADRDEAHVLAHTTMGGNTDLIKEPAKEVVRHGPEGEKHKAKKPFFARKVEKWFVAPYAQKYERVGYMMYKGAMRVEKGVNNLAAQLDEAIRDAGVEAVNRVEVVMRKYIKFFGAAVLLTAVLLPLPSVHMTLSV